MTAREAILVVLASAVIVGGASGSLVALCVGARLVNGALAGAGALLLSAATGLAIVRHAKDDD